MKLFKQLWRKLNQPADDLWLVILAVALLEIILLLLAYWVGPSILPK